MLYLIDERTRGEEFANRVRFAYATAPDPERVVAAFPEWFLHDDEGSAEEAMEGDPTRIVWSAPQDENEHAALERWLAENEGGGVVAADELEHAGGGGWV